MFDKSKIDNSNLTSGKPITNYDTTELEKEGFKLEYNLDYRNPIYEQIIDECKRQNVAYKIIEGENSKKHIWIKQNNNL